MGEVGIDCSFWRSRDGILKAVELVISLLILILTSESKYTETYIYVIGDHRGKIPTAQMTYVYYVASFCCITLLISIIIYVFKLYHLPLCDTLSWENMEVVFCVVCAVLNFFGMAVAANAAIGSNFAGSNLAGLDSFRIDFYGLYTTDSILSILVCLIFVLHAFLINAGPPPHSEADQSWQNRLGNVPI